MRKPEELIGAEIKIRRTVYKIVNYEQSLGFILQKASGKPQITHTVLPLVSLIKNPDIMIMRMK